MNNALIRVQAFQGYEKSRCYCFLFMFNSFGVGENTFIFPIHVQSLRDFYVNVLFKKMWVMDRVCNFWKVMPKK